MLRKIGMMTILSTTLLLGGVLQSTVDASASAGADQSQSQSNNNKVYYSINGNSDHFSRSNLYNYFNTFNKKNWNYKIDQGKDQHNQKKEKPNTEKQDQSKIEQPNTAENEDQVKQVPQTKQVEKEQTQTQSQHVSQYEQQVVEFTNNEREKHGLSPLKEDWELSRVAQEKSRDMAVNSYFAHNSPVYGSPFDMMKSYGITYRAAGENIAKGQRTPQDVVNAWMNSPGHRANILNENFTHIGVGFVEQGNHWTQQFIGK